MTPACYEHYREVQSTKTCYARLEAAMELLSLESGYLFSWHLTLISPTWTASNAACTHAHDREEQPARPHQACGRSYPLNKCSKSKNSVWSSSKYHRQRQQSQPRPNAMTPQPVSAFPRFLSSPQTSWPNTQEVLGFKVPSEVIWAQCLRGLRWPTRATPEDIWYIRALRAKDNTTARVLLHG